MKFGVVGYTKEARSGYHMFQSKDLHEIFSKRITSVALEQIQREALNPFQIQFTMDWPLPN
jgi:hypothetical protein